MESVAKWKSLLFGALVLSAWGTASAQYGIMPVTTNTLLQRQADRAAAPDYELPPGYVGVPRELNLLTNVTYDAKKRDQGHTGSCWMWGCQAVMWLDYARQFPEAGFAMTNGFSLQFISSYLWTIDLGLNEGGTPQAFKRFFESIGYAIPWGNTNAAWTDGKGYVATPPSHIYTTPRIPIDSMQLRDVNTFTSSVEEAKTLLKSVLDSGRAMHFNMTLADGDEWDKFMNFWGKSDDNEETIFTNFVSGKTLSLETGGSHMMACVGYNDTDADTNKHYWLILNSWSTGDNPEDTRRPHGTWRLPMNMDYGAHTISGVGDIKAAMFDWGILDTTFTNEVRKHFSLADIKLNASDPSQTLVSFEAPITAPGVISGFHRVVILINDRYFTCSPENGSWRPYHPMENIGKTPYGDLWLFQTSAGQSPAITLLCDVQRKKWTCQMTDLSDYDCRFIDLHDGLRVRAEFMETETSDQVEFLSNHSMSYDDLAGFSQQSGPFSSPRKNVSFTFLSPANGAQIRKGETCVIEWTQQGMDNMLVGLTLNGFGTDGRSPATLADLIPIGNGRYEWRVPMDIRCVTNQALRAVMDTESQLTFAGPDISIAPSTDAVFSVRSPVANELWMTGTVRSVSWEGYNLTGDMVIELLSSGQVVAGSAVTASASAQRADFTLPASLSTGDYALRFSASGISLTSGIFSVTSTQRAEKAWTIMVYFDADNDLEAGQLYDFLDIARVGSSANVNVLVQMDRIPGYHIGYENWVAAKRYYMTNGITPTTGNALVEIGEISAVHPDTYTDFVNWGAQNYPAENYMLIMCDHGEGWSGALYEMTPNADYPVPQPMTTFERGISNAVVDLDIVGYDTCNMAEIHAAYQLRNTGSKLFIGSQYMETMGWAYEEFLGELQKNDGAMTPRALAKRICELSAAKYAPNNPVALSVVALDQLEPLVAAISNAAGVMISTPDDHSAVRQAAAPIASNYYQAVIHRAVNQQTQYTDTGLNIYFPQGQLHTSYPRDTLDFKAAADWPRFLSEYTNRLAGTWIGEIRRLSSSEGADVVDIMRFFNNINPPDDTVWLSLSVVGRGEVAGLPAEQTIALRKGDAVNVVATGKPAEEGQYPHPASHFVRWWSSDGVTFSNALTDATNALVINGNASVIAYFSDNMTNYTITVSAMGNGLVNGMADPFNVSVAAGADATPLFATPGEGYTFAGWGGDISETANPLILSNVISDLNVLALFWEAPQYWSNDVNVAWWQAGVTQFTLTTPLQLAGLARMVNDGQDSFSNKVIKLGANLDLSGKEWTPIGNDTRPFGGSFNGQGHTINGLTINGHSTAERLGLFGAVGPAGDVVFENVHLTNTVVSGGSFIGGLIGQVNLDSGSATVRNCSGHGSLWGSQSLVGGLLGEVITDEDNGGGLLISNCVNRASIRGTSDLGGILGRALVKQSVTLTGCSNEGGVTADGAEVGGIVGFAVSLTDAVNVERCVNTGVISGDADYVGGIGGRLSGGDCTMDACRNHGDISIHGAANQYCGGLAGHLGGMLPSMKNGLNTGDIFGHLHVGGVVGYMALSVQNCSNEGRVEGHDCVGGVAGSIQGETAGIQNCHNAGVVVSTGRVGGVAGRIGTSGGASASGVYFLQTATTNAALPYVGEMVPTTNCTSCATFTGMDGALSTNGYGDKTRLANALNAWVSEQNGACWWNTNRNGSPSYPWPDYSLTEAVVSFRANGGVFVNGSDITNKIFTLGRPYGTFPDSPLRTNHAFVGWWYVPEPDADPAKLLVDLTALPSINLVDAWWSATVQTATPLPVSVEKLAEYYPDVATMTEEQINTLANSLAANGRDMVWELVFLGLNPTDPGAKPDEVFVYMTVNPMKIYTVPENPLQGVARYAVWGKKSLMDPAWDDLNIQPGDPIPEDYRFFCVIGE